MTKLVLILKLLLFACSNLGWYELLRRRTKIDPCFYPSAVVASQVTLIFLGGLLNVLTYTVLFCYGMGLLCLAYWVKEDKSVGFLKEYCRVEYAYLLIALAAVWLFLRGKIIMAYDDFSHWALIVKQLLAANRFPNFLDTAIIYEEYPLGSAIYVYYFARFVARAEDVQLLGQAFAMLAATMPVFSYCRKNKWMGCVAALLGTNLIFTYGVNIADLKVDTLLGIAGMCSLLYLHRHCQEAKGNRIELWLSAAYLSWVMQIKNSGIFYGCVAAVWMLVMVWKQRDLKERFLPAVAPFVSVLLWHKHCGYVFESAYVTRHAMTIRNSMSVFGEKTPADIKNICIMVAKYTATFHVAWAVMLAFLVLCGLAAFLRREKGRDMAKLAVFGVVLFLVYQVGVMLMYLFSMPLVDAYNLASISRYTKTMLASITLLMTCVAVDILSDTEGKRISVFCTVFAIYVGCMLGAVGGIEFFFSRDHERTTRRWLEELKEEYGVEETGSYSVLMDEDPNDLTYFIARFLFRSREIEILQAPTQKDLEAIDKDIVFIQNDQDAVIRQWVETNYPEQAGNRVIFRNPDAE